MTPKKKNTPKESEEAGSVADRSSMPEMPRDIIQIAIKDLVESPFNHRESYPENELNDLAVSIGDFGVLQPILVRPIVSEEPGFEIIYGHRRKKASVIAGLSFIPCIVRDMDDTQAVEAQIIENLVRQDVTPLEEARGYIQYMKVRNCGPREVADRFECSPSQVVKRIQLLKLIPDAAKALDADKLPLVVAQELSRMSEEEQTKLFKIVTEDLKRSRAEDVVSGIRYQRHQDLKEAKFDTKKTYGKFGPCGICEFFSGSNPDLFEDLEHMTCTNAKCFHGKSKAHMNEKVEEYEAKGFKVVRGSKVAGIMQGYGSSEFAQLKDVCSEDPKGRTYAQLIGKAAKDLQKTLAVDDTKSIECYAVSDLCEAIKKAGHDFIDKRSKKEATDRVKREEYAKIHKEVGAKVLEEVAGAALAMLPGDKEFVEFLRVSAESSAENCYPGEAEALLKLAFPNKKGIGEDFKKAFKGAKPSELVAFLALRLVEENPELLKTFDVDAKAIEKAVRARMKEESKAKKGGK